MSGYGTNYYYGMSPAYKDIYASLDSLQGLADNNKILLREPNWIQLPKGDFDLSREVNQYTGTTLNIYKLIDETISELTYLYTNLDKESEYYFTKFFNDRKGKHKKFWVPYWKNPFKLQSDISSGDKILTINNCYYNRIDFGYERIFFKLKNNTIITRQVTAVLQRGLNEDIILTTAIDRDIKISDIKFFSRLLLVRFNNDSMKLKFYSDDKSDATFTFRELPFEHTEVES